MIIYNFHYTIRVCYHYWKTIDVPTHRKITIETN